MFTTFTSFSRVLLLGPCIAHAVLCFGLIAQPAFAASPGGPQVTPKEAKALHRQVLTIGLGPGGLCQTGPFPSSPSPQSARPPQQQASAYTWEQIVEGVTRATRKLNAAGYDVMNCSIGGSAAEAQARKALQSGTYDVVVVGAGLRLNQEHLFLFERVLNAVRELQPGAKIALHTTPEDFADAVIRVDNPQ